MTATNPCSRMLRVVLAAMLAGLLAPAASAQPAGIDDKARSLMQASTAYLARQQQFSVDTRSTLEAVLQTGQKIEFDAQATLTLQRPDRFRAERSTDLVRQTLTYDGRSLTLYSPDDRAFATLPAPPTLEAALDFSRDSLGLAMPAGDLVHRNAYDLLMRDVVSGFVVGKAMIEGVRCDHLAFRGVDIDFQIWIQDDGTPLPRKLVITSRNIVGSPAFSVVMTRWNMVPRIEPGTFTFTAPQGARQVVFVAPTSR